jgi:hypothetical protein
MEALIERVKQDAADQRADAVKLYRELLARASQPQPGDAEALAGAMRTLGLTTSDVERDLATLERMERGRGMVKTDAEMRERADVSADVEDARKSLIASLRAAVDRVDATRDYYEARRIHILVAHALGMPPSPAVDAKEAAEQAVKADRRHQQQVRHTLWKVAKDNPRLFDDPGPEPFNPVDDLTPHPGSWGTYTPPGGRPMTLPTMNPVTGAAVA